MSCREVLSLKDEVPGYHPDQVPLQPHHDGVLQHDYKFGHGEAADGEAGSPPAVRGLMEIEVTM